MQVKMYPAIAFLAFAALLSGQSYPPAQGPPSVSGPNVPEINANIPHAVAALAQISEILGELRKLRAELLGFYVVAKQEKASDLELKVNELRAQRERVEMEERRATQHLAELDTQLATATGEDRERLEAEKSSRTGPALEQLRDRRASLGRREDDLRGLLSTEQQRLLQLKQLVAAANVGR